MTWDGSDDERPLSSRGERQADRLGRFLAGVGFRTDAIITSPKVRAVQTAEIVAERLGVPVGADDRLAGNVGLNALDAILHDAGDPATPILVGHDPDFSDLVVKLCGGLGVPLRKCAFARIDAERPFEPGRAVLRWLVPPDLLKPDR
jgi:phosphohistidine phosphatase